MVDGFGGLARAGSLSGVKSTNKSSSRKAAGSQLAVESKQANIGGLIIFTNNRGTNFMVFLLQLRNSGIGLY